MWYSSREQLRFQLKHIYVFVLFLSTNCDIHFPIQLPSQPLHHRTHRSPKLVKSSLRRLRDEGCPTRRRGILGPCRNFFFSFTAPSKQSFISWIFWVFRHWSSRWFLYTSGDIDIRTTIDVCRPRFLPGAACRSGRWTWLFSRTCKGSIMLLARVGKRPFGHNGRDNSSYCDH